MGDRITGDSWQLISSGKIIEANTYHNDPHESLGRFDFLMANPPFNVSGVDKDRLKDDKRSRKACRAATTPTIYVSSCSIPRSTTRAAPVS